jgi:hypothetical protein
MSADDAAAPALAEPPEPAETAGPTAREIAGLLAAPVRLRVVAALALGASTAAQVSERSGIGLNQTRQALSRLVRARLVDQDGATFVLREPAFGEAARAGRVRAPRDRGFDGLDPQLARVLRTYLVDGRLQSIPASRRKRLAVLQYLASVFEPGQRYPEVQVNAILRSWHPDVAALRRYLVDESLLAREAGEYWRIGGWLDLGVDPPA